MVKGLFLIGEDTVDEVKQIRRDARKALATGKVVSWNSESTSVQKVLSMPLAEVIEECNYFLRLVDPKIRQNNPIRDYTRPFLVR